LRLIGLTVIFTVSLTLVPLAVEGQQTGKVYRIGFVGFQSPGLESRMIAYFQDRLAELGYVNGGNTSIAYRWADGKSGKYPLIAEDLVRAKVDVIVTPCGAVLRAVRKLNQTIPLVVRSNGGTPRAR